MPQMLREIIEQAFRGEPDFEIVGEIDEPVLDTCPDVLILEVEDGKLPDSYGRLLAYCPRMRVVGLTADGREAFLYELAPRTTPLGALSPAALLEALRQAR
jgi:hypothetical protein